MTQTIEQAARQLPYSLAHHALPLRSKREPLAVCHHQGRAAGQARLLWSYDDICSDLCVPRLIFNRAHRNGVIPRASIRSLNRGRLFYDGRQYLWLQEFFGLVAESETLGGTGRFTHEELVRLLAVSKEGFNIYKRLYFSPRPRWNPAEGACLYSPDQLAWWVRFLDVQARMAYDPSVNFLTFDEAHLSLGLPRDAFLRLLDENPALRPVLSLKPKNELVYHREYLSSLRWSLAFRPGTAMV